MSIVETIETKKDYARYIFVESVPTDCEFPSSPVIYPKIGESLIKILAKTKKTIHAISFYFSLRAKDVPGGPFETAHVGEEIYKQLQEAAKRGVYISLLANVNTPQMTNEDMTDLQAEFPEQVNIGFIDMSKRTVGFKGGICHTKLWIMDDKWFYVGSSNIDWRSYTEIVETGIVGKNRSFVMDNLKRLFLESAKFVDDTKFNEFLLKKCPYSWHFDNDEILSYTPVVVSSSPYWMGRERRIRNDKLSLLEVINTAKTNLYLSTYEYSCYDPFTDPHLPDNSVECALIEAAFVRKVEVNIIVDSKCLHVKSIVHSLQNLLKVDKINIKIFDIKEKSLPEIPYAKLWHSKLAVSESKLWISTNNIAPSYFALTCGIGILFDATTITYKDSVMSLIDSATGHFKRYWFSEYCENFDPVPTPPCETKTP